MAFPIASRRSVSFPRGTRVTYVTRDVSCVEYSRNKCLGATKEPHVDWFSFVFFEKARGLLDEKGGGACIQTEYKLVGIYDMVHESNQTPQRCAVPLSFSSSIS